jgi:hypothetical protein
MAYIKKYDGKDHYYGKKNVRDRKRRKDGSVYEGKGKVRPHHKQAAKAAKERARSQGRKEVTDHDRKTTRQERVHRTPNKYQTEAKKVGTSPCGQFDQYQWLEDNGHKDHLQLRTVNKHKDEDSLPFMLTEPSPEYKKNYNEIKGFKRKRGAQTGKFKKFKKVYK